MATTYLHRTTTSTGSNTTATFSGWVKRATTGTRHVVWAGWESSTERMVCGFESTDRLQMQIYTGGTAHDIETNRLFRDVGAWYHLVFQFDTSNASEPERFKMWVNGVQETSFNIDDTITQDIEMKMWGSTSQETIVGARKNSGYEHYFDGEMSNVHIIDGTVYAPTEFGETDATSGIWKFKNPSGLTYGTNGTFLLDNGAVTTDSSSNSNNYSTGGTLTATQDNPSNNFVTMNPLYNWDTWGSTLTNGNTTILNTTANKGRPATLGIQKGKWYWEVKNVSGGLQTVGIVSESAISDADLNDGDIANGFQGYGGNRALGFCYESGQLVLAASTTLGWGSAVGTGDIVQVAVDLDNSKLYFGINGTWQNSGDPTSGSTGTGAASITSYTGSPPVGEILWFPLYHSYDTSASSSFNFGNGYFGTTAVSTSESDDAGIGSFEYDVPTGYYALCTKNIKAYGG